MSWNTEQTNKTLLFIKLISGFNYNVAFSHHQMVFIWNSEKILRRFVFMLIIYFIEPKWNLTDDITTFIIFPFVKKTISTEGIWCSNGI